MLIPSDDVASVPRDLGCRKYSYGPIGQCATPLLRRYVTVFTGGSNQRCTRRLELLSLREENHEHSRLIKIRCPKRCIKRKYLY